MCVPKPPKITPQSIPERQPLKLPDGGATAEFTDDAARRRRAMASTAFTGALGLGSPTTTTVLGG
jgi:hypothetical protein